jgi:Cft2 family RNA processing exonuclease
MISELPASLHICTLATILDTMRRDGNVLICVDTAGRVLELALLLVMRAMKSHSFSTFDFVNRNNYGETNNLAYSHILWRS